MKLIWCAYRKNPSDNARLMLLLKLGEDGSKTYALYTKDMNPKDVAKIRHHNEMLDRSTLTNRIKWVRDNCPEAMLHYKTITTSKLTELSSFDIKR